MKKLVVVLCALSVFAGARASGEEKKELVVGVYMSATGAIAETQQFEYAKAFFGEFARNFGYGIKVIRFSDRNDMVNNFVDGSVDIASFSPEDYVKSVEGGKTPRPLITVTYKGQYFIETCFWHSSDIAPESPADMIGKKMVYMDGLDFMYFAMLRKYFLKNGVDRPLWEIFPEAFKTTGGASPLLAITNGDGDILPGFSMIEAILNYGGTDLSKKIKSSFREKTEFGWSIMAVGDFLTDEEYAQMRTRMEEFIANTKKYESGNKVLKAMDMFLKQMNAKTVMADPEHYARIFAMYEDIKEKGWVEEGKYLAKLLMSAPAGRTVSLAPTRETCDHLYAPGDPETPAFCK